MATPTPDAVAETPSSADAAGQTPAPDTSAPAPAPWWAHVHPDDVPTSESPALASEPVAAGAASTATATAPTRRHHSSRAVALIAAVALAGGLLIGRAGTALVGHSSSYRSTPWNGAIGGLGTTPPNNNANNGTNNGGGGSRSGDGTNNGGGSSGGATSGDASAAANKVSPAIVNINTQLASGEAAGTGMIITSSGEVLTNNHVINGATKISVEISDGSTHSASVLGYDVTDDVALIQLDGVSGLPTISASTASVSVGSPVVALGNALGKGGAPTVVTGSVTAINQTITASDEGGADAETLDHLIQTDAAIQPGDSGGPLTDTSGNVIGMDTAASAGNGFARFNMDQSSEAYAIPIQDALTIAKQIAQGQSSDSVHIGARGILGVQLQTSGGNGNGFGFGDGGSSSSNGAVVGDVESGSPAAQAGITGGDTITAVNGTNVASGDDLANALGHYHPGDKVSVSWVDGSGASHSATVQLEAGPPA